jgi:hypothetical protein
MNPRKTITLFATVLLPILLFSTFVPAVFADSATASATPSPASPNTTITISNIATLADAPSRATDGALINYIAVLTPSGTIVGCVFYGGSPCNASFSTASSGGSGSGGTGTCNVPYGGASASFSSGETGGITLAGGTCSGNDIGIWGSIGVPGCSGYCSGTTGYNDLVKACSGGGSGSSILPSTTGDTSQVGTYLVVVCWLYFTATTIVAAPATTSFVIAQSSGVPQFPLGSLAFIALIAATLPLIYIIRARRGMGTVSNL